MPLLGEVGHREADRGGERPHEQVDFFAGEQLLGDPYRIAGIAVVVAGQKLQRSAEDTATVVDFLDRELHALLVRFEERRERLVAVELTQLDRLRRSRRRCQCHHGQRNRCQKPLHGSSGRS